MGRGSWPQRRLLHGAGARVSESDPSFFLRVWSPGARMTRDRGRSVIVTANLDHPDGLRTWKAESWEEIHSIWSGLMKKYQGQAPSFRAIDLDDQQAGWVFEHLILE